MELEKIIEKIRLAQLVSCDGGLRYGHYEVEVIEKGDNYVIVQKTLHDKLREYSIYFEIAGEAYYTISTVSAMKAGRTILTTRKIEDRKGRYFEWNFNGKHMEIEKINMLIGYLDTFRTCIEKFSLVRMRVISGVYEWFYQDANGRYALDDLKNWTIEDKKTEIH